MTDKEKLKKRHRAIRKRIFGTKEKPRMQVFRSLNHIYVQFIDDENGKVILEENDVKDKKGNKSERALEVGKRAAKKAKEKNIKKVVFDRKGYLYHGRVKAVAQGAREEGLDF